MGKSFLIYEDSKPLISECQQLAIEVLKAYRISIPNVSPSSLKKKSFELNWNEKDKGRVSKIISLNEIANNIQENRAYIPKDLGLPNLDLGWLDNTIALGGGTAGLKMSSTTVFGEKFPIRPTINGAGAVVGTFQGIILSNIISLYHRLIENSENAQNLHSLWFNDFRILIGDCIASIEITLHQFYLMAEYHGVRFGWSFSKETFGDRKRRAFENKLHWVKLGTGVDIYDRKLYSKINQLKELRNHLSHFDPPCFAFELSDLIKWFNLVSDIGRLLLVIRKAIRHPINGDLIKIICLPQVKQNPDIKMANQTALKEGEISGYKSSIWPEQFS